MRSVFLVTFTFLISITTLAIEKGIGQVALIKGEASVVRNNKKISLTLNAMLDEADIISTSDLSLLKITLKDKTNFILGANSTLEIKKYSTNDRQNIFNFIKGSFRTKVQEKVKEDQSLQFMANQVSVGVRGTEFLTNTYTVSNKGVSDLALLEGNLQTAVTNSQEFALKAGEVINTTAYQTSKEVKKLSESAIKELLSNELSLLPKLQDISGKFNEMNDFFETSLSTPTPPLPTIAAGAASAATLVTAPKVLADKEEKKEPRPIAITNRHNLKNEPWDIRDAILRRKEMREDNNCFYWFYKALPGSGELERFRRERDCDDFEYDL
ncbi:FecR family protein [Halobacteriovorax marinus]|uniref:FecR family protein n=1 Tax=Halobacteriovorax marinus TaxID=97084 RepID=UPI003A93B505